MLSLPDLPLEVLEAICRPLKLRDRVALTSCCRTLLARQDVAGSAQLWGSLGRAINLGSTKEPPPAGFLARHAAGLKTLRVELGIKVEWLSDALAAVLGMLGGSGLVDLEIIGYGRTELPDAALEPLSRLTALTRLKLATGVEAFPAHLSALQRLAHLELSWNEGLGRSSHPDAFEGLAYLLALTSLELSFCGLSTLPPHLSSLTRLQVLRLFGNPRLGVGGEAVFEVLQHLPTLRTLHLSVCGLQAVPRQLASLPALEVLDLARNRDLGGNDPAEAFPVLCQLSSLTSLSIRGCQLRLVPPQLASLTALANLELGGNFLMRPASEEEEEEEEEATEEGEGGPSFLPLQRLTALTRLDLSGCSRVQVVPPQVAALTGLLELDLSGNAPMGEEGEAAFQVLLHLSALTRLNLGYAGLTSLPPQLSALGGCLLRLELPHNQGLGLDADEQALQPLCHATALTALDLRSCSLKWLPLELCALGALQSLKLGDNEGLGLGRDYEQVFGPLQSLPGLTHLGLSRAGLLRLPAQLLQLRALQALDVIGNEALGRGEDDEQVFGPLRPLRGLTYLILDRCGLQRLPPQLSELRALRLLDLSRNKALGQGQQGDPDMWRQLSGLTALERLEVVGCSLHSPAPPPLLELAHRGLDVQGLPVRVE